MIKALSRTTRPGVRSSRKAFTLIELIVVIVIIGILAAVAAVAYNSIINQASASGAEQKFASLAKLALAQSAFDQVAVPNHANLAAFQAAPYAADLPAGLTAAAVAGGAMTATIDGYDCSGVTFSGVAQTSVNSPTCSDAAPVGPVLTLSYPDTQFTEGLADEFLNNTVTNDTGSLSFAITAGGPTSPNIGFSALTGTFVSPAVGGWTAAGEGLPQALTVTVTDDMGTPGVPGDDVTATADITLTAAP